MVSDDQAALKLPQRDQDPDSADISEAANRHLAALRTTRRVWGRGKAPEVEVLGEVASKSNGEDEVDNEWFAVPDDLAGGRVRLSIGKVPRRAGTAIRRTLRDSRRRGTSAVAVEEVADDGFDLEDDEAVGGSAMVTAPSTAWYTDGMMAQVSASSSAASLVSLELPALAPSTTSSSRASRLAGRPGFSQLVALPTLSELCSGSSTTSSSPPPPTFTPDGPSRTLTVDDRITRRVSRRDTRSSFQHLSNKHGFHFPGRGYLPRQRKKAAAAGEETEMGEHAMVSQALKKVGFLVEEENRVVVDVLYEHQRGLVVFGLPKFSSNALFQTDPPQWCDDELKPSPFTPHTYPCPPYWVWRDSVFMVDMGGDKDEEGWAYAVRFRSRIWRGEAIPLRSFVRRRRWIRTRIYRPQALPGALSAQSQHTPTGTPNTPLSGPENACEITDLRSACSALPLAADRRAALFAESTSPSAYAVGEISPRNPFISYRSIKLEAAASADLPSSTLASAQESRWRDAVRELNFRRAVGVLKAHARIDRQRLELWRLWLGARRGERGSTRGVRLEAGEGAGRGAEGEGEKASRAVSAAAGVAQKREKTEVWDDLVDEGDDPDVEDVWDVIEARLDPILALFDYHHTRLLFLQLVLSRHPAQDAAHRYAGYDAPSALKRNQLEKGLGDRLAFCDGVKELAVRYGADGGWLGANDVRGDVKAPTDGKTTQKGKRRAD